MPRYRPNSFWPALTVLLTAAIAPAATAQSMDDLEARLFDHPVLSAMRYGSQASRERADAATGLPDPVVTLGVNNFPIADPSFDRFLPTNKAVGIRQQIPNRAGRDAKSAEAFRRALQNDASTDMRFAELRADLEVALIEKRRIDVQRSLATKRDEKYAELVDIVQTEIDAGRPVVFRLAEIDVERAEVARTLTELDGQLAQIDAALIDLVGMVPATTAPALAPISWNGEASAFHMVRVADKGIDVADASVDQAKAAYKPDWGAQLTYQQRDRGRGGPGATFAGDDWVSGAITFTVPLWAERTQAPALRAAKADREAARARHMASARTASAQYAALSATYRAAQESVLIFEQKVSSIREQIAAQLTTYESGVGDYSPIIDGEIATIALRAQIALEQARRDKAIARMNSLLVIK